MSNWLKKIFLFVSVINIVPFFHLHAQETIYNSTGKIKAIVATSTGELYLGTSQKICQFDGQDIKGNCIEIENSIDHFIVGPTGQIICATANILTIYFQNEKFETTLPELITCLINDQNKIYIGTAGMGVFCYDLTTRKSEVLKQFASGFINDLMIAHGKLVVAEDESLSMVSLLSKDNSSVILIEKNLFTDVEQGNDEYFFAVDFYGNIYKIDFYGKIKKKLASNLKNIQSTSVSARQLFLHDLNGVYEMDDQLNLKPLIIGSFDAMAAGDNLLFLSQEGRLIKHDITHLKKTATQNNYSLFLDEKTLWAGTNGSVLGFENDSVFTEIKLISAIERPRVSALYLNEDRIYAGTLGDGVFVYNRNGDLLEHLFAKGDDNKKNIIQIDACDDLIWIAYLTGVMTIHKRSHQIISDYSNFFNNQYVYCILPLAENHFFVGTSGDGVFQVRGDSIENYLPDETIYTLENHHGKIYAGCEKGGVYEVYNLTTKQAPCSNVFKTNEVLNLKSIGKYLFIGCDDHNYLFNPLNRFDYRLPSSNLNDQHLNASASNANFLYVGFDDGIAQFNIQRLNKLLERPLAKIQVNLFDIPIDSGQQQFEHYENTFTFSYDANALYQPGNTYYKYRLIGLDSNWIISSQPNINFYKLSPGDYAFEIAQGIGTDFNPNQISTFNFSIKKAFWTTIWFWVIVSLCFGIVLLTIIRYRDKQKALKEERKRAQLTFDLDRLKSQIDPHFLFNSLNSLMELIEESPTLAVTAVGELSDLYRNILDYQSAERIPIEKELRLGQLYFNIQKIRFGDGLTLNIDLKGIQKRAMLVPMSTQVLIENAIKHNVISKKHQLILTVFIENDCLVVLNNKTAKKLQERPSGLGLKNLEKRYEIIASKSIVICDEADRFLVKLPLFYD